MYRKIFQSKIITVIVLGVNHLHSERLKLYTILAFLSAIGLKSLVVQYINAPERYRWLKVQSDLGLHYLLRHICPNISFYCGKAIRGDFED